MANPESGRTGVGLKYSCNDRQDKTPKEQTKVRSFRESFHFAFEGFFVKLYFKDFCIWRLFRKIMCVFWKPDFDLTAIRAGPKYS